MKIIKQMRSALLLGSTLAFLFFTGITSASARGGVGIDFEIGTPTPEPVYERPWAAPAPGAVWVRGHYHWVNGRWVWYPGYYTYAPYDDGVWVDGFYEHHHDRFYRWHEGHWDHRGEGHWNRGGEGRGDHRR